MHNSNRGSALVTALFIMTLVAIAATAMSTRLRLDIYRTSTNLNSDKLYLASQAVTWWAMGQLSERKTTTIVPSLPQELQHLTPGILTEGALFDLQANININSLLDKHFLPLFYRLLENRPETITSSQRKLIFDATTHWISPYKSTQSHDSFSGTYLQQNPPYYPAHQPMKNLSEFRLVDGVTAPIYQTLLPNITALPDVTAVNINTAPFAVLKCLGNGLNKAQVQEILQIRGKNGDGINAVNMAPLLTRLNIPNEQVTFESNYFLSVATTSTNDSHLTVYTVIKRTINKRGEALVSIVSESLNTP